MDASFLGILLIAVHLLLCLITLVLMKRGKLYSKSALFPLVLCIPVFGFACLIFFESKARKDVQALDTGLEELRLNDEIHRSILVEQSIPGNKVIPLQEALAMDDTRLRRELIMDILYDDPSKQVPALELARSNDDVEVVHYATTAMVELQKQYEQELADLEQRTEEHPDDGAPLREYARLLDGYISSGLLEGNIIALKRKEYAEVLKKRLARSDERADSAAQGALQILEALFENALVMDDMDTARYAARETRQRWPKKENSFLMDIRIASKEHDQSALQRGLQALEDPEIFLTSEGRQVVSFWKGGAHVGNW